jgi:hypothetical protein
MERPKPMPLRRLGRREGEGVRGGEVGEGRRREKKGGKGRRRERTGLNSSLFEKICKFVTNGEA